MDKPTKPPTISDLIWGEAERTGNTDALCAATGLTALVGAACDGGMPAEVARSCVKLLIHPLADGLGEDPQAFLAFALALAEAHCKPEATH